MVDEFYYPPLQVGADHKKMVHVLGVYQRVEYIDDLRAYIKHTIERRIDSERAIYKSLI